MKNYLVAVCGALTLVMSTGAWSNDDHHGDAHKPEAANKDAHAAPAAAPAAKADEHAVAPVAANDSAKPARKKKGRAAKKAAAAPAAHADDAHSGHAIVSSAEQAKRIHVRQRGELASAVDAAQGGHAHAADAHAADTHAAVPVPAAVEDHAQPASKASVPNDGRASAVIEDRYMAATKPVETPAAEQSSYSLIDRHPAEFVRPAGDVATRDADSYASHAEPARAESPSRVVVNEPRQVAEPVAAAPAPVVAPAPAPVPAREAATYVQDPALACNPPLKSEVAALFDRWNASLRTGDPKKVVANYAPYSVLLPTVSNRARFTAAEKEDYFRHFLERKPEGRIDDRVIEVDCNSATDAGLYTFRFADGTSVRARYSFSYKRVGNNWLISSHHSSGMPEQPPKAVAQPAEEKPVERTADRPAPKKTAERNDNWQRPEGWVRYP